MATLEEMLSQTEGARRERLQQALAATTDLLSCDERQSILNQTLDGATADLRKRRDSLPDSRQGKGSGAFTQLDNVLLPLMQVRGSVPETSSTLPFSYIRLLASFFVCCSCREAWTWMMCLALILQSKTFLTC